MRSNGGFLQFELLNFFKYSLKKNVLGKKKKATTKVAKLQLNVRIMNTGSMRGLCSSLSAPYVMLSKSALMT